MHGIIINEDSNHYFFDRQMDGVSEGKMRELVRHYCRGGTAEVIYNVNAMRSSVGGLPFEPVWTGTEDRGDEGLFYRGRRLNDRTAGWIRAARRADEIGLDPYTIWLDETRKLGRKGGISIRMNDIHFIDDEDNVGHSDFWRDHPECRREPGGLTHGWYSAALDFSQKPVRDYSLRMIKAVLERYEPDTLELDWMRFGLMVRPGYEDEAHRLLTDFLAEIRDSARAVERKAGHAVLISARCPTLPQEAYDMGYDVVTWAKEDVVDRVVPSPLFMSTEFEIPVSFWRKILPDRVRLAPCLEIRIQATDDWSSAIMESPATLCAQAANYFSQGADQIYLFNHMDSQTSMPKGYGEIFELVGDPEKAAAHERRHIITLTELTSCGSSLRHPLPMTCPADCASDYLRIDVGPAPEEGRACELVVGVTDEEAAPLTPFLNGKELPSLRTVKNRKTEEKAAEGTRAEYAVVQEIPLSSKTLLVFDASKAVRRGRNLLYFLSPEKKPVTVNWTELHIR